MASDFLDEQSLPTALKLARMFRLEREPDPLLLQRLLWHGWQSLSAVVRRSESRDDKTRQQRRDQKARKSVAGRADHAARRDKKRAAKSKGKVTSEDIATKKWCHCPHLDCNRAKKRRCFDPQAVFDHLYVLLHLKSSVLTS